MNAKQLDERFNALKELILSRRATCRDTEKSLRNQLKALPKEEKGKRVRLELWLDRTTFERKRYDVPITKFAPLHIHAPKTLRNAPDIFYNGRLIQQFLKKLGTHEILSITVNPRTYYLEIAYKTPRGKGSITFVQMFIDGSVFEDHRGLIPTYDVEGGDFL